MTTETKQIDLASLKDKLDAQAAPSPVDKIVEQVEQVVEQATSGKQAAPAPEVIKEKMYHVFYSGMTSCRMITTTGRVIAFVLGKYVTDVKDDIEYLQGEIAAGSRNLSVVPGEEVMSAADLDPMASLKKRYFKEFALAQAEVARKVAAGEPLTQSESEVQQLTPGSTSDIASLASGS